MYVLEDVLVVDVLERRYSSSRWDGLYTSLTFPGHLTCVKSIPALRTNKEGALGGTSYHQYVADLRSKQRRPYSLFTIREAYIN